MFERELVVERVFVVGGLEADDALCLFGGAGEAVLAESILYGEQVLKLLYVPGLLLQLDDVAHHLQPHPHRHHLQALQRAQRLLLHLEAGADLLGLALVEGKLGGGRRGELLVREAVGEVGRVGEDVGVGFVLEAELAEILEAVGGEADLREVADEGVQLRFGLGEEGQFSRTSRHRPSATFSFHINAGRI